MEKINLIKIDHPFKVGDSPGAIQPNLTRDSVFYEDGKIVGFYIRSLKANYPKADNLSMIANKELRSERVPKSTMKRSSGFGDGNEGKEVLQYSTIIGSVPPKPHMRRPYPTMSSVHSVKSAQTFIKAMLMLCEESEAIIKEIAPETYENQARIISEKVPERWRFGRLFTSSISNFNIAASFHRDSGNLEGCVNVIVTRRQNSTGGNTTVPEYGVTVDSCDGSMLVYPAWKSLHAVTPIVPTLKGGYRNSLVFYPLKAFNGL